MLDYFRIKVHDVIEFNDFFGIEQPDIKFNADMQEFLSLDLKNMVYEEDVHFDKIRSSLARRVTADIYDVVCKRQFEEAAVDDFAQDLFFYSNTMN